MMCSPKRGCLVPALLLAVCGQAAHAQFLNPNVINTPGPINSSVNGLQFVNYGMVGVGRIPAFLDAQGSTFGSVSSLAVTPGSWSFNPSTGAYSGEFQTLPDRGRNDPASGNFLNYQNRVQKLDFSFKPLFAGNGSSQDQISFNYTGLTLLSEASGAPTVGNDPGAEVGMAFGKSVPRNNGNLTIDAEGLVALPTGDYFVSDEYASAIYRFNASGTLTGVITPPEALVPRNAANGLNFSSLSTPATGRRQNQGMEALSVSPDGRYLFAMNQSAAVQDSTGSNQANRRNTRVLVYDLAQGDTPSDPVGHYAMTLPTFDLNGNASGLDRTAAQSEIVAISNTQFMVLARDGNGRGPGTGNAPAYKSVILADITGATNLVGTVYNGPTPIASGGNIVPSITPVSQAEALNMLNLFDLGRFGLNLNVSAAFPDGDMNTLSEKWEGLALVPDLATPDPFDYFLFIANDNDFITRNGIMKTSDGTVIPYSDGIENDTMFLAYKISLIPAPGAAAFFAFGSLALARRRR
ncbi:MAG: esterase-like activity of phytase family protein [Phycisphaerales bacterium]